MSATIVLGPAPCTACRRLVWLLSDRYWYEGRTAQSFRHTLRRCLEAQEKAA